MLVNSGRDRLSVGVGIREHLSSKIYCKLTNRQMHRCQYSSSPQPHIPRPYMHQPLPPPFLTSVVTIVVFSRWPLSTRADDGFAVSFCLVETSHESELWTRVLVWAVLSLLSWIRTVAPGRFEFRSALWSAEYVVSVSISVKKTKTKKRYR